MADNKLFPSHTDSRLGKGFIIFLYNMLANFHPSKMNKKF